METTTAKPKHTQGKWDFSKVINGEVYIVNDKNQTIAKTLSAKGETTEDQALANAQRMVKAVNMHDELIKTLHTTLSYIPYSELQFIDKISKLLKEAAHK